MGATGRRLIVIVVNGEDPTAEELNAIADVWMLMDVKVKGKDLTNEQVKNLVETIHETLSLREAPKSMVQNFSASSPKKTAK